MKKYNFTDLITEKKNYGSGITFIDIDATTFNTDVKIHVVDKETGKVIKKLSNAEFNTYKLSPGQEFDFGEFRSAKEFYDNAVPIPATINRIKKMTKGIDRRDSKIVFLTARESFDNNKLFFKTFAKHGIPLNKVTFELSGDNQGKTVAGKKKTTLTKYLSTGKYRRVRMLDDDMSNIKMFNTFMDGLPNSITDKVNKIGRASCRERV